MLVAHAQPVIMDFNMTQVFFAFCVPCSRLTSGSIGSEEEFNMANGDASSSDSAPSLTNRPAIQQFKKQKEQAAVEGITVIVHIKIKVMVIPNG